MEPATMMGIGALASGAGQILSGLGFGGGSKGEQLSGRQQQQLQLHHERQSFEQKMQMAHEQGLHPLAMMGVPMSSVNITPNYPQDSGPDFAAIGAGVNTLASSVVKPLEKGPDSNEQRIIDANVRLAEANAKRAEWDALRSEFSAADQAAPQIIMGQPGNPPGVRRSNDVIQMEGLVAEQSGLPASWLRGNQSPIEIKQKVAPPHPRNVGHTAATDQGWQRIQDANGQQTSVVRSEAVQSDIEKGATFQALAKVFGIERAMQITAIMENEHLLMGTAAASGFLLRHPLARLGKFLWGKIPPYKPNWKKGGK